MFALCGAMIVVGLAYIAVGPPQGAADTATAAATPRVELAAAVVATTTPVDVSSGPMARSVSLDAQAGEAGTGRAVPTIRPTVPSTTPPSTVALTTTVVPVPTTIDPLTSLAAATAVALVNTVDTVLTVTLSAAVAPTTVPVAQLSGHSDAGVASWFNAPDGTCAHRTLPFGTVVKVTRAGTGKVVSCKVNDRGPTVATGRLIDLSMDTFAALAPTSAGLIDVTIEW